MCWAKVYLVRSVTSVEGNTFGRVVLDERVEYCSPAVEEAEVAAEGPVPSYCSPCDASGGVGAGF